MVRTVTRVTFLIASRLLVVITIAITILFFIVVVFFVFILDQLLLPYFDNLPSATNHSSTDIKP